MKGKENARNCLKYNNALLVEKYGRKWGGEESEPGVKENPRVLAALVNLAVQG